MTSNGGAGARMLHRITVLGDGGVGKTALTVQFTMSSFVETYDPTIEDCYRKQWVVDDQPCMLEVLDTAGQEEYTALRNQWIKDGEGFLLVYSIAARSTFDRIEAIYNRVITTKQQLGAQRPPIIIVGNKRDKSLEREVSPDEGANLANALGADFFIEVSARTNQGVESAFRELVRMMSLQKDGIAAANGGPGGARGSVGSAQGAGRGTAKGRRQKKKAKCVIL